VPVKRIKVGQHATLAIHALPTPTPGSPGYVSQVEEAGPSDRLNAEDAGLNGTDEGTTAPYRSDGEGAPPEPVGQRETLASGNPGDQLGSSWTLGQVQDPPSPLSPPPTPPLVPNRKIIYKGFLLTIHYFDPKVFIR
jgi:hypothetical protein